MSNVHVVGHPLVQHKLTLMRDRTVSTKGFRQLMREIGMLLAYEVTRDLPLEMVEVETPLAKMMAPRLPAKSWCSPRSCAPATAFSTGCSISCRPRGSRISASIATPSAGGSRILLQGADVADRLVIVIDPMLATANSAVAAIDRLRAAA